MIITRYLAKEVYSTAFAVTLVLVLVFLGNQTVRFLSQAATGGIPASVILHLIMLELPYLLGLLLPLGLYLGILIAYSRLYADQEMTILFSAGMNHWQLFRITLSISGIIFLIVSTLVFGLNPYLAEKKNNLMTTKTAKNLVAALVPGSFKISQQGQRVIYVGGVSRDHKTAKDLFVADLQPLDSDDPSAMRSWTITAAKEAFQKRDVNSHQLFIVAQQGHRYQGSPGSQDIDVSTYKQYGVELPEEEDIVSTSKDELPSWILFKKAQHDVHYAVEWQWRMALPISVVLLSIMAQLLSRVAPRQGRFQRLMPALLIYIIYANLIFIGRSWMSHGQIPAWLGLWCVHGLLLLLILILAFNNRRV
ncbi:MAG: LPS export ABC transporter permease LptF [Gammaproteobacteria bacterium]|nr:LPS export ABC transporter permease LptF [Gammaproteobacteria bacterium]MCD8525583.1 LPS export ABC transporter permease LptF [Gammaproteobacteria bacterium]MCD8542255.1 LPS export ABC transporter permease LptF [Gammaproteobacteria bacterium]